MPTGPADQWEHNPFSGFDDGTFINGRGTGDMKGGIACFMSALSRINIEDLNVKIKKHLSIIKVEEPAKRQSGIMLKTVDELVDKLKNEAKVI